jgi:hypothetical protein
MGRIQISAVWGIVLAAALSLFTVACSDNPNPIGPSGISTRPQPVEVPTGTGQPPVTFPPPLSPTPPPVVSGQPPMTPPAPSPHPVPNVTLPLPGSAEGGGFSMPR